MSADPNDPPRLAEVDSLDPVDDELRRAIGEARRVGPSPLESAAMSAALAPILGPLGGGAAGGGAAGGGAAGSGAAASGATGSVGLGTIALGGGAATAVVLGVVAFVTFGEPAGAPTPAEPERAPRIAAPDDTDEPSVAESEESSALAADDDGSRHRRSRARTRSRHRARAVASETAEPAETVETPVEPSAVAGTTTAEQDSSEAELLEDARAALRSDPSRALALAAEHERRFAGGPLAQEREVIAIEALVRLGRRDAARARADRFHTRFRSSLHHRHIEALLER